jgi:hypothetical protein
MLCAEMPREYIVRRFSGSIINQRSKDGYINLNQMADAAGKRVDNWLRLQETQELITEFNAQQELTPSDLRELIPAIVAKEGRGGGTWAHPDIAIQFAQWCSPRFALQVSRWVREWMSTGRDPLADVDRAAFRDQLKDKSRIELTDAVKIYLEQIRRYDDKSYRGRFFAESHDLINRLITTETARQMRTRLSSEIGEAVKDSDLIRDYFPSEYLQHYVALCRSAANFMLKDKMQPLAAIEKAAEYVLPPNYSPSPINFVEHIQNVRRRIAGSDGGSIM